MPRLVEVDAFVGFTLAILLLYFLAALGLNTDMRMLARGGCPLLGAVGADGEDASAI